MRVRICADGDVALAGHVSTVDADTGEPLHEVRSIHIEMRAGEIPIAEVTLLRKAVLDVVADATVIEKCPACGLVLR